MTQWTSDQLDKIGKAEEAQGALALSPLVPGPTQQFKLFETAAPECDRRPNYVRVWVGRVSAASQQRAVAPIPDAVIAPHT